MGRLENKQVSLAAVHTPKVWGPSWLYAQVYSESVHFAPPLGSALPQGLPGSGPVHLSLPWSLAPVFAPQSVPLHCGQREPLNTCVKSHPSSVQILLWLPAHPRAKAQVPPVAHRALPNDLLVHPSLTPLQPQWPPSCFLNIPDTFQPQGLCTGCFPCPDLRWLLLYLL